MRRHDPDRALRAAAAELARLHPDDSAAILDALEPGERAMLERLLAGAPEPEPSADGPPAWRYEGLSPWLVDRIAPELRDRSRRARAFVLMTPATEEALRAAAEPCRAQIGEPIARGAPLLSRVFGWLAGTRA